MTLVMDADRAVELKDRPDERYEYSIQYLPLPAAFRHAAIALRTKIRERKREGEPFEDALEDLYDLACVRSAFVDEGLGIPTNHALPPSVWQDLEFSYDRIGRTELSLLKKRDRKRMWEAWGESNQHTTVREGAPEAFERLKEWRQDVAEQEERAHQERMAEILDSGSSKESEPSGCLPALLVLLLP